VIILTYNIIISHITWLMPRRRLKNKHGVRTATRNRPTIRLSRSLYSLFRCD